MKRVGRWLGLITGVSLLAWYYYFIGTSAPFDFSDEGYLYYLSWAMGEGKLPFRDFELTSYPPGLFAFYGVAFKLLGAGVATGRIVAVLWLITSVCLTYCLVREVAGRRLALPAALIVGLVPGPWHKAYIGTLCLAALLVALRIERRTGASSFILMGGVIGLGLQVRLDAAVGAVVLLLIAGWRVAPVRQLTHHMLLLVAAMAVTMFPLLSFLGANGLIPDYGNQLLNFAAIAAERSAAWYRLPSPSITQLVSGGSVITFPWLYYTSFLIPIMLFALALKIFISNRFRDTPDLRVALLVAVWVLLSIPQYAVERPDAGHLCQRGFALIIGAFFLLGGNGCFKRYDGITRILLSIPVAGFLGLYLVYGLTVASGGGLAYRSSAVSQVRLANGMEVPVSSNGRWGELIKSVEKQSVASDRLAAVPYAPGLNFVLKLHTPGRKNHYFPNVIRTAEDESVAAAEIVAAQFIVFQPRVKLSPEPRAAFACYAPMMTQVINSEYTKIAGYDNPLLLVRKSDTDSLSSKNIAACQPAFQVAR